MGFIPKDATHMSFCLLLLLWYFRFDVCWVLYLQVPRDTAIYWYQCASGLMSHYVHYSIEAHVSLLYFGLFPVAIIQQYVYVYVMNACVLMHVYYDDIAWACEASAGARWDHSSLGASTLVEGCLLSGRDLEAISRAWGSPDVGDDDDDDGDDEDRAQS